MNSLVIYGSRHGNTQKIAYAIAAALRRQGSVQVLPTEKAASAMSPDNDLVAIGGPTEAHQLTPPIAQFFEQVKTGAFKGKLAAAFDTRLRWPHWIVGSASHPLTGSPRLRVAPTALTQGASVRERLSDWHPDRRRRPLPVHRDPEASRPQVAFVGSVLLLAIAGLATGPT